ncbi:MAG: O-antigen ligase family protein [Comamonadaceae bacterium]|nr:MAG: O-antigen ligase family protein [Comamonadaceae bacterium]
MQRSNLVRPAAMFWGAAVFLPVGAAYAGLALVLIAMLSAGALHERAARLRGHPLRWPTLFFVAWTLAVLAFGPHYPQTPSNLVHGLRIALTIVLALALRRDEAVWALRGFIGMALASLAMIALFHTVLYNVTFLHLLEPWRAVLVLSGNKSISNALLFTIVGAGAAVLGLHLLTHEDRRRPAWAIGCFAITAWVLAVVTVQVFLPSRTSLLAMVLVLPLACLHRWRRQLRPLAVAMLAGGLLMGAALWQSPGVQQKFALGVQEIEAARAGAVSEGSWVVRFHMYRETARMIADRPFAGWGIGGWTEQWHLRGPKLLADYNMPHNDFLWMGAQTGLPGSIGLLAILLTGLWTAWRRPDLTGRLALVAMAVLLLATSVNSALRDAQIGLGLLWIAMVCLRLVDEPGEPWGDVVPARLSGWIDRPAATGLDGLSGASLPTRLP